MKSFCVVAFLAIFIGYSFGIPTKVHGYDEYMLQNNLKQLNQNEENYSPYQVYRTLESIGGGHLLRDLNAIYSADKSTLKSEKNARLSALLMKLLHHIETTQGEKNDIDSYVSGSGFPSKRTIDSIGGANLLKK
ncbi:uncharacterized protein LOC129612282 isoform X1 [Condylostylus longicornis]|uniref:uncharacterized protein LOC129612282 isoform X1 n=1 Tax=Condylostylus longicornis TaxID=2530218 RepID=UPI00244E483B|nr:uncharacterized protein LOC129612282 isoform X1 [Condylostylus longicornis]